MNPEEIEQLRAASLRTTLGAARQRRWRRRAGIAGITVLVAGAGVFALRMLPPRTPEVVVTPPLEPSVALMKPIPPDPHVLRTEPGAATRIRTAAPTPANRVRTEPGSRAERVSNEELPSYFPGKEVAIIQVEGEPARLEIF